MLCPLTKRVEVEVCRTAGLMPLTHDDDDVEVELLLLFPDENVVQEVAKPLGLQEWWCWCFPLGAVDLGLLPFVAWVWWVPFDVLLVVDLLEGDEWPLLWAEDVSFVVVDVLRWPVWPLWKFCVKILEANGSNREPPFWFPIMLDEEELCPNQ